MKKIRNMLRGDFFYWDCAWVLWTERAVRNLGHLLGVEGFEFSLV